jgi:hypothetical protein
MQVASATQLAPSPEPLSLRQPVAALVQRSHVHCVQASLSRPNKQVCIALSRLHFTSQPSPLREFPSSQSSPRSTTPLPHTGAQSESAFAFELFQQHPSPLYARVIETWVQTTLQFVSLPVRTSSVQGSSSRQLAAQGVALPGSHVSPEAGSTTPSPQRAEQSLSS